MLNLEVNTSLIKKFNSSSLKSILAELYFILNYAEVVTIVI